MSLSISRTGLVAGGSYLALGALWLFVARPPGSAPALAAWIVGLAVIGAFLPGVANQVSLSRAYLAAPALVYAGLASALGPLAVCVALAGLTDLGDGTIARRFDRPTRLGGALDPVVDGIFFGAAAVGLALGDAIPAWLVAMVIVRYALPALVGGALLLAGRSPELRHTLFGQVSTSLMAILLGGVALFRGLHQDARGILVVAEVAIPLSTLLVFLNLGWVAWRAPASEPAP